MVPPGAMPMACAPRRCLVGYSTVARISEALRSGQSVALGQPAHAIPGGPGQAPPAASKPSRSHNARKPHHRVDRRQPVILTDVDIAVVNLDGHSRFCLQRRIESAAAPNCPRASWSIRIPDCASQRAKLLPRLREPRIGWLLRLEPRDLHPKSEDHQSPSGALPRLIVGNRTPLPVVPLFRSSTRVVRER